MAGALATGLAPLLIGLAAPAGAAPSSWPPVAPQVMVLERTWRIEGETERYLIGRVVDAALDEDGRLLLLDVDLADVKLFGPDGSFLGTISRRGEGPGETTRPAQLLLHPERGLGLLERFPPRIVWLDADGVSAGRTDLAAESGLSGVWSARLAGDRLFAARTVHLTESAGDGLRILGRRDRIERRSLAGGPVAVLWQERHEPAAPDGPEREHDWYDAVEDGIWDVDREGRVWLAPERDRYRVIAVDGEGARRTVVDLEIPPRRRTAAQRELIRERHRHRGSGREIAVDEHAPAIDWLRVSEAGRIWIGRDPGCPDGLAGLAAAFDVFSTAGEHLRSVEVRADLDCRSGRLFFVADDRVVLVRESVAAGEAGAPGLEIVLARLRPAP